MDWKIVHKNLYSYQKRTDALQNLLSLRKALDANIANFVYFIKHGENGWPCVFSVTGFPALYSWMAFVTAKRNPGQAENFSAAHFVAVSTFLKVQVMLGLYSV